jgi:deazaflavin-dependent oxidoreductase (nitroreductase family)
LISISGRKEAGFHGGGTQLNAALNLSGGTFEEMTSIDKRAISRALAKYGANPIVARVAGYVPWWSLLETTGRKSSLPRRNPVGSGLQGNTFWIVAEHGRSAGYVRNIETNPRVRIRVNGRWRTGTAHLLPDDDPRERQRSLSRFNSALVRTMGTDLLTVRIDLDE